MEIYNPNKEMFYELEIFLQDYILNNPTEYPISIHKNHILTDKFILYNTEQLTRNDIMFNEFKNSNIVEVWDYSLSNIDLLKKNGILNVRHVPLKITDDYRKKLLSYNPTENYLYDVIFVGWVSERREFILNELIKNNVNVEVIGSNPIFGDKRDKLISNSKILLNIHYNEDYNIFESIRCSQWLDVGKIIISENSLDNDERCYNVDYKDIVNKTLEILGKK